MNKQLFVITVLLSCASGMYAGPNSNKISTEIKVMKFLAGDDKDTSRDSFTVNLNGDGDTNITNFGFTYSDLKKGYVSTMKEGRDNGYTLGREKTFIIHTAVAFVAGAAFLKSFQYLRS